MKHKKHRPGWLRLTVFLAMALMMMAQPAVQPARADPGDQLRTPVTPMELPVEVEIELSPAGSLKQAALWKELIQLLRNPYAPVVRRPGFGATMPPLNVYPLDYNFLTGQPMRLRTSDGEVSWDQPGPLFDPNEPVALNQFNTPTVLRTPIGHAVACPNVPAYQAAAVPATFCDGKPAGSLVIYNPSGNSLIPPSGTVVAVAAVVGGVLQELDGVSTTATEDIVGPLEIPVNEEDFYHRAADSAGVPAAQRPFIGRPGAEVLGKALFWDMQVGSDGVQSCGSCHFANGVDPRTRNQVNPDSLGGDVTFQTKQPNQELVASDFPFHKLVNPDAPGDPLVNPSNVISDSNDVASSMGVSRFKQFVDIPPIGPGSFGPPSPGSLVRPLLPDIGAIISDTIPAMDGFRRVEPRNTPTFHGAAFNFDNFWDGRARFNFNGGSVFGPSDPQKHIFIDPGSPGPNLGGLQGATGHLVRPDLYPPSTDPADPGNQPVRIKFSSLASQSNGPPLSEFEMSFLGRNWPKIGKKLLQNNVTPLANQLVDPTDSVLGPFSGQRSAVGGPVNRPGRPGLNVTYTNLIQLAFRREFWQNNNQHLNGAPATCTSAVNGVLTPAGCDPFDGYVLTLANGAAVANNTNQFRQIEANFSAFFGLAVQAYEELTIPDNTPADRFFDVNPNAGHAVGEPGDQAVLFPTLIPDLLDDGLLNGTNSGCLTLIPDDPATAQYDGFGPDEVFGFDLFAGGNLTAGLCDNPSTPQNERVGQSGIDRNPIHNITTQGGTPLDVRVGSNPFTRSAKCMLCHLGPEQTDHSINIAHGLLKNDAEFEYPTPPRVPDPNNIFLPDATGPFAGVSMLPAPEPSGSSKTVPGLILSEELEGAAQDAVEVEPRNFAALDDPLTPWDDRIIAQPKFFAFGDQGIYNLGVRPIPEDTGRGGNDPFGWPLSLSALTLKNIGGTAFEPCDSPLDSCVMANFDAFDIGAEEPGAIQGFEETGDGATFPGSTLDLQSLNPGFERDPILPQLPVYMVPWTHSLPAGELHPQIDEMAGMVPNTTTPPNGGPGIEFPEIIFGADFHCARYDPAIFGLGPPNFGWGAPTQVAPPSLCPQTQSGVTGNMAFPSQGTWPVPNRVLRDGAFKAPPLRNVEMTGPYFHTGSFLTLRQVVDFYFRGGDFLLTNAESRDPNINDLFRQGFSFGTTKAIGAGPDGALGTADDLPSTTPIDLNTLVPGAYVPAGTFIGSFADGLPDTLFLYDQYPDSDHPFTPELTFPGANLAAQRAAAIEDAKTVLVKFLLALTDSRVKFEKAPFDRPELFVPIDGQAPENTGGRTQLVAQSGVACPAVGSTGICFQQLPPVGAAGRPALVVGNPNTGPLPNFLNISSTPVLGPNNDHFDP